MSKRFRPTVIPSLKDLCFAVLLPDILARNDRYFMMDLGPDLSTIVFNGLKERGGNGLFFACFMFVKKETKKRSRQNR
jgi:hypothetical protein